MLLFSVYLDYKNLIYAFEIFTSRSLILGILHITCVDTDGTLMHMACFLPLDSFTQSCAISKIHFYQLKLCGVKTILIE